MAESGGTMQEGEPRGLRPTLEEPVLYRFLEKGEIIQEGDENPDDQAGGWEPVSSWAVGLPVAGVYKSMRRRVVAASQGMVDAGALQRVHAWVMSEVIALDSADSDHAGKLKAFTAVGARLRDEMAALSAAGAASEPAAVPSKDGFPETLGKLRGTVDPDQELGF